MTGRSSQANYKTSFHSSASGRTSNPLPHGSERINNISLVPYARYLRVSRPMLQSSFTGVEVASTLSIPRPRDGSTRALPSPAWQHLTSHFVRKSLAAKSGSYETRCTPSVPSRSGTFFASGESCLTCPRSCSSGSPGALTSTTQLRRPPSLKSYAIILKNGSNTRNLLTLPFSACA
jgi:hypothetical protein